MTLALRPALSSDLVLYLAAHAGGRHVTAAAPSFSYTFPSVGRLLPPPPPACSFWVHGFLVLGETHSMVRRGRSPTPPRFTGQVHDLQAG